MSGASYVSCLAKDRTFKINAKLNDATFLSNDRTF